MARVNPIKITKKRAFYHARFQDPELFSKFRVPAWSARIADKVYHGTEVTEGKLKYSDDKWEIQKVMIPIDVGSEMAARQIARKVARKLQNGKKGNPVHNPPYEDATNNELAQYIINLSNELTAAKSRSMKKEIKYLEKDIKEVKAVLAKRKIKSNPGNPHKHTDKALIIQALTHYEKPIMGAGKEEREHIKRLLKDIKAHKHIAINDKGECMYQGKNPTYKNISLKKVEQIVNYYDKQPKGMKEIEKLDKARLKFNTLDWFIVQEVIDNHKEGKSILAIQKSINKIKK